MSLTVDDALVDIEGGLRDWYRTLPSVTALAGQRIFTNGFRPSTAMPAAVILRVGGGDDPGEAPIDQPLVQLDIRGAEKADAWELTRVLVAELRSIRRRTVLRAATGDTPAVIAHGAVIESVIWLPDPSDQPRYVVTAAVTASAA